MAKEDSIVVSGLTVAEAVFKAIEPGVEWTARVNDGDEVQRGREVAEVSGRFRSLLAGERTALNFLQRLSGIATLTRKYVQAVAGTGATLLDTRKTTPGWRALEKAAVRHGGGTNHRMGLFEAFMVKDNHLLAISSTATLAEHVAAARARFPGRLLQLEADTLEQLEAFLGIPGVDSVLLDNMTAAQLRQGVDMRNRLNPEVRLEASGGVNLETIGTLAATGVDFISVGALTHGARSVDFSLDLCAEPAVQA